jgi:hypothetical protein
VWKVTLDLNSPEASVIYDINSEVAQSIIEPEDAAPSEEDRRREEAASMEAQAALIRKILLSINMTPREFIRLDNQQRSRVLAERGARP